MKIRIEFKSSNNNATSATSGHYETNMGAIGQLVLLMERQAFIQLTFRRPIRPATGGGYTRVPVWIAVDSILAITEDNDD